MHEQHMLVKHTNVKVNYHSFKEECPLMKECSLMKEHPPPTFGPIFYIESESLLEWGPNLERALHGD